MSSIGMILIGTDDPEGLASFYATGLEFDRPVRLDSHHVGYDLGGTYLGFEHMDPLLGTPPSRVTVWFDVPDLHHTFNRLLAIGAKEQIAPTSAKGDVMAVLYDPDGNFVCLRERK